MLTKNKFVLIWLVSAILFGCAVPPLPSKPVVSIGSPAHGAQVNVGQEVLVQVSAVDPSGIVRVELWVNGQLHSVAQPPSPQTTHAAVLRWTPASAGAYTLVAKAVNVSSITSEPAAVAVNVVGEVTPTTVPSVLPSATSTKPTATMTAATPTACVNDAAFVEDVTVPDGTNWAAGQAFNKIWRVRNSGTCAWGPGDEFVFVGGEAMTTQSIFLVPVTPPGSTADLLVAMIAPTAPGAHTGQWRLRDSKSGLFGATMTVKINVLSSSSPQGSPPAPGSGCAGAPVIASFSANPTTITAGQSSALSWGKVDNADSAVIDQGIGGIATPGSTNVKPDKTTTYTLTATGCGGTATKQMTVTVSSVPAPPAPKVGDLAVTKIGPVSTTRADKVYVDIKNTGTGDLNDANVHVVCQAMGRMRGNPTQQVPTGSDEWIKITLSAGGTGFFWPGMIINVPAYSYDFVTCVAGLDGDPTPNDNTTTITIP